MQRIRNRQGWREKVRDEGGRDGRRERFRRTRGEGRGQQSIVALSGSHQWTLGAEVRSLSLPLLPSLALALMAVQNIPHGKGHTPCVFMCVRRQSVARAFAQSLARVLELASS